MLSCPERSPDLKDVAGVARRGRSMFAGGVLFARLERNALDSSIAQDLWCLFLFEFCAGN
jgi:hypothetical protein